MRRRGPLGQVHGRVEQQPGRERNGALPRQRHRAQFAAHRQLGDVTINQAVITNFALIENTVGQIVGLQVDGVLQLTGGVLGTNVVTENFTTTASVTSSGPGQCNLVSIDLGPIAVNALVASVDIPAATLTAKGSGAVGSLLCNLASALSGLLGGTGAAPGAGGIVNALNHVI